MQNGLFLFGLFSVALAARKCGQYEECCNVRISVDMIPVITTPLPILKECDQVEVPCEYFSELLQNVAPQATLNPFGNDGALAAFDEQGTLVSFVRPDTGESRVFPQFEGLKPGEDLAPKAMAAAIQFANDSSLFPKDDTELVVLTPKTVFTSKSSSGGNSTDPEEILSFVRLERQVNGIPVDGPGTQATIAVDGNGCIQAFAHRYRPASLTDHYVCPYPPEKIVQLIIDDLAGTCDRDEVVIDQVVLTYYDSGNGSIRPAYRYQGSIPGNSSSTPHAHVLGSIPVGPDDGDTMGSLPTADYPSNADGPYFRRYAKRYPGPEQATVGRYVPRNDSILWLESATAFFNNLQLATSFGSDLSFINEQYLEANSSMFVSDRNQFVNSVQIALNELHGDWDTFSTYKTDGDLVTLSEIAAAGGLGCGADGHLAYWILHSCEVIPTQTDLPNSFDVWWGIFRGLRSVVGYRTDMWIDDDVTANFGLWLGLGAGVVPAWFLELAVTNWYGAHDQVYFDYNRGFMEPLGRPSSVSVCGHLDDTAFELEGLDHPNCLVELWMEN